MTENDAAQKRVHLLITGRVQGVFYRASAMEAAREEHLTGWVRNLPDGRVEVVAEGESEALERFVSWCRRGPAFAVVREVRSAYSEATGEFVGFQTVY